MQCLSETWTNRGQVRYCWRCLEDRKQWQVREKKTVRTGEVALKLMTQTLNFMWKDKMEQQGKKMILAAVSIIRKLPGPGLANE